MRRFQPDGATCTGRRSFRRRRWLATIVMAWVLAVSSPVAADEYDPATAGHPLRILAYVLHPVGVVIDYVLMRPAHWLVSREPMKTLFGHED